jgi:hypothetical protein
MTEPILVFLLYKLFLIIPLISSLPTTTVVFIIFNTLFLFICYSVFLVYIFITFHHICSLFVVSSHVTCVKLGLSHEGKKGD